MENTEGKSLDVNQVKINELKQLFPEILTEGKIDFEKFKLAFGDEINTKPERYELSWAGKQQARREIQKQTTATLVPENPTGFKNPSGLASGNIFIEGENLEVLRVLQKSYYGKIKMIYIDPPYNTGSDSFVYPDDFGEGKYKYQKTIGDRDENNHLNKLDLWQKNVKENGQYHSNWLSMMYPRLFLARNLLSNDGVIFVSIDDNEVHNLRLLMNEIFGEENFIGEFIWVRKKKGAFLSKKIRKMTEYILCYQKSENDLIFFGEEAYSDKQQPIVKRTNALKKIIFPPNIIKTKLKDGSYENISSTDQTGIKFLSPIEVYNGLVINELITEGKYVWTQEFLNNEIKNGSEINLSTKFGFNVLRYNQDEKTKTPSTLINKDINVGTNEDASEEIANIFKAEMGTFFSYAKPTSLVKFLIKTITFQNADSIILDFFAGSGTTAQAVLELNKEDGGNRQFICVQMPEKTDEKSEANKAGYATIADICKERIKRVIEKMLKEDKGKLNLPDFKNPVDLSFKTYKLTYTNFKIWQTENVNKEVLEQQLLEFKEPVANYETKKQTPENLLTELILKSGFELTVSIEKIEFDSCEYFNIANGAMYVCLQEVTSKLFLEFCKHKPQKIIVLSQMFTSPESEKILGNATLQLKDAGIEMVII